MSFRAALRALERLRPHHNGLRARPAGPDDVDTLVEMAFEGGRESGKRVTARTADSLRRHFEAVVVTDTAMVFLVEREGRTRGMVTCGRTGPDVWDGRPSATVWALYTVPEERKRREVVSALLSAAAEQCLAWGVRRCRVMIPQDEPKLIARYEKTFGFRKEAVQ